MKVEIIKCLKDNYSYLLINEKNKNVSTINNHNLFFKNLFAELGIFLIEK